MIQRKKADDNDADGMSFEDEERKGTAFGEEGNKRKAHDIRTQLERLKSVEVNLDIRFAGRVCNRHEPKQKK